MSYKSVDELQKALAENVFHYAKDSKKAAGRALGTIVEIITFYLLKTWALTAYISIEKQIPEYGNPEVKHNVEYTLHPMLSTYQVEFPDDGSSITSDRILKALNLDLGSLSFQKVNKNLLSRDGILRNACIIGTVGDASLVAFATSRIEGKIIVSIHKQSNHPFAIFECKRVGVEEGMRKGPQTIEKAKQGAYVARTVSALQKVRLASGELYGIIYKKNNVPYSKPYTELLAEIINSHDAELLERFILTVGVVSNHGNWFTGEERNKELKVLSESYDWLIFLTDQGIREFIDELILSPASDYTNIRKAFLASYHSGKKKNQFTKVQINFDADGALLKYFSKNLGRIEHWFNIIAPASGSIDQLKLELNSLKSKPWEEIV